MRAHSAYRAPHEYEIAAIIAFRTMSEPLPTYSDSTPKTSILVRAQGILPPDPSAAALLEHMRGPSIKSLAGSLSLEQSTIASSLEPQARVLRLSCPLYRLCEHPKSHPSFALKSIRPPARYLQDTLRSTHSQENGAGHHEESGTSALGA
jgi:hypothetical protein